MQRDTTHKGFAFGFNELVRVTSAAGGLFGGSQLIKAARVQRRYRRGYTDAGDRILSMG